MKQSRRPAPVFRSLALAVAAACLAACTGLDDYVSGTPFTLDQPVAEVTLQGEINADPTGGQLQDCAPGGTVLWGVVRNTGDLDVDDVSIEIDAFSASNALLGTFRTSVFSGEIIAATDIGSLDSASTSLVVDAAGSFLACTQLSYGSVARTEYRTGKDCRFGPCFTVIEETE